MVYSMIILLFVIAAGPALSMKLKMSRKSTKVVLYSNILVFCVAVLLVTFTMFSGAVSAETAETVVPNSAASWAFISAALSVGIACIGAGIAVAAASSSALGAISDQPEIMGKALIFVALAEGIALYGMLISFSILGKV